jgi:flagellar assembly protein FliH
LSDMVIKSENIHLIDAANRTPARFKRYPFGPEKSRASAAGTESEKPPKEQREEELKAAEASAYARGCSDGMKKGAESERANLRSTIEAFSQSFEELSRLKAEILKNSENEMLSLAFSIAEKVIHQEVSTNRDIAIEVMKTAVKDILDREGLKIRLSPVDYHHLMDVNPEAVRNLEGLRNAELEADETVGPGGVIVETLYGEVDARIDRQLSEVKDAVTEREEH